MEATTKEWEAKLRALEALVNSEGWGVFNGFVVDESTRLLNEAVKADNPVVMARALGASRAVAGMASWPERQIVAIRETLKTP